MSSPRGKLWGMLIYFFKIKHNEKVCCSYLFTIDSANTSSNSFCTKS